ncbi:MAG: sulfite exporter TauE/SafE family protein [Oligoflexia bacterium]|nr:sulfite exporter TauE/SafE family protein [Oligoflexia bacterium]
MVNLLILFFLGCIIGILSSFLGIGGGIIATSSLYILLPDTPPQTIIGTSLGIIFISTVNNTITYLRSKKITVNKGIVLYTGVSMMLFTIISGRVAIYLDAHLLKNIFGIVLLLAALKSSFDILLKKKVTRSTNDAGNDEGNDDYNFNLNLNLKSKLKLSLTGIIAGFLSGITGLGGGIVLIPMLSLFLKIPAKIIPFYSNAIMVLATGIGAINYLLIKEHVSQTTSFQQIGHINFFILFLVSVGSVLTSKIGVYLNRKISSITTEIIFTILMFSFSIKILHF